MPAPVSSSVSLLTSTTLAGGGSTTFNVDFSAKVSGTVQVGGTFGSISTTAGIQIEVFRRVGSGPTTDTQAALPAILAAISGAQAKSIALGTGRYTVKLTNLDTSNAVTAVSAVADQIDSYS